jgi:YVTN family beta-propeller protein
MLISREYLILALFVLITPAMTTISFTAYAQQQSIPPPAKGAAPDITVGEGPSAIAVNPNTNKVYVANKISETVSVIDGTTDKKIDDIPVGILPSAIAVNPNTNKVYVLDADGFLSVIDGKNDIHKVSHVHINTDEDPPIIAVNTNRNIIYIGDPGSKILSVIDGKNDKVLPANITIDVPPEAIAVNPNTNKVYVLDVDGNVMEIDELNHTALRHIFQVEESFFFVPTIAVNPNSNTIYILIKSDLNILFMIDPYAEVQEIIKEEGANIVSTGSGPSAIAVNPNSNTIYVTNRADNTVSVIDGTTNKKIDDIPVGILPSAIAVNPKTNTIYTANERSNTITVIDGNIDAVVTGVIFDVNPSNTGHIKCDNKEFATGVYRHIKLYSQCKAEPNNGFQFSSWGESLRPNSTRTISTSTVSNSPFSFLSNLIYPNDPSALMNVSKYGHFIANFKEAPSPIPREIWISLFGIMLGTVMPSIIRWINGWKQRRNFYHYMEQLPSKYNNLELKIRKDKLNNEITEYYANGKINESQHKMLKEKVSEYYNDNTNN